jgi:hypothetical protein
MSNLSRATFASVSRFGRGRHYRFVPLPCAVFALCAGACGDKGSIALTAAIQRPSLSVTEAALGSELGGGFELYLEVGPQASEPSAVELERMDLQPAGEGIVAIELSAEPQGVSFPLQVGVGDRLTVSFELVDQPLLDEAEAEALCSDAAYVRITLRDSLLAGQTLAITSEPIEPDC